MDPVKRITGVQALQNPYFDGIRDETPLVSQMESSIDRIESAHIKNNTKNNLNSFKIDEEKQYNQ